MVRQGQGYEPESISCQRSAFGANESKEPTHVYETRTRVLRNPVVVGR